MQVARVPIGKNTLMSPYELDSESDARILPAEDFTVSITTISKTLFTKYKEQYEAGGPYKNNYFVLVSESGMGKENKPTLKLHYVQHIDQIQTNILDLWNENVRVIEDYRDIQRRDGEQGGRLYLSFQSFCQNIGDSRYSFVKNVAEEIASKVGAIFPNLTPYISVTKVALEGMNRILEKILNNPSECKTTGINFYPSTGSNLLPAGDAYLQTGSYLMFFEDISEQKASQFRLEQDGLIYSSNNQQIPPYIVVNITKGIKTIAPEQLDISVAREILDKYQANYGHPLPSDQQNNQYVDGLKELGKYYRSIKMVERYYQLQKKGEMRSPEESAKMEELKKSIHDTLPDLPM